MKSNKIKPDIKIFTQLLEVIPPTVAAENKLLNEISNNAVKIDTDFYNILIKKEV